MQFGLLWGACGSGLRGFGFKPSEIAPKWVWASRFWVWGFGAPGAVAGLGSVGLRLFPQSPSHARSGLCGFVPVSSEPKPRSVWALWVLRLFPQSPNHAWSGLCGFAPVFSEPKPCAVWDPWICARALSVPWASPDVFRRAALGGPHKRPES